MGCTPSAVCVTSADCAPGLQCVRGATSSQCTRPRLDDAGSAAPDAGVVDSGVAVDAGTVFIDAGTPDAGPALDAGTPADGGAGRGFVVDVQVSVGARTLQGAQHTLVGSVVTGPPVRTLRGATHTMQVHSP
jgi:hypothetical protein